MHRVKARSRVRLRAGVAWTIVVEIRAEVVIVLVIEGQSLRLESSIHLSFFYGEVACTVGTNERRRL